MKHVHTTIGLGDRSNAFVVTGQSDYDLFWNATVTDSVDDARAYIDRVEKIFAKYGISKATERPHVDCFICPEHFNRDWLYEDIKKLDPQFLGESFWRYIIKPVPKASSGGVLLKKTPLPRVGPWQPIDTAPKDGSPVFCWHPDWEFPLFCSWTKNRRTKTTFWNQWDELDAYELEEDPPTYWLDLPMPPSGNPLWSREGLISQLEKFDE